MRASSSTITTSGCCSFGRVVGDVDFLEPLEVGVGVAPVTGGRPVPGRQQPDLVVVVQSPDRDAREPCHLFDRVLPFHAASSPNGRLIRADAV